MPARSPKSSARRTGRYRSAIRRLSRTVPVTRVPFWRGQAIALACVTGATMIRLALDPVLTGVPYVTFFPALLIASIWGGTRAGLTTLVLGWLVTSFLWLEPHGQASFVGSAAWKATAFAVFGSLLLVCAAMLRDLMVQLRCSEDHARLLASEMEHRIENLLATATALARQTASSSGNVDEHVRLFEARIAALGRARKLAVAAPDGEAELGQLVADVLSPFGAERFALSGPPALVPEQLASMLALALHELATNALKYGALSEPDGHVGLRWSRRDGRVELIWTESGGPPVQEPAWSGFGSRTIRSALASHGAESELRFVPEGLCCRISFPEPLDGEPGSAPGGALAPLPADGLSR